MAWSLSDKERTETTAHIASNISNLAFFRGHEIADADADAAAAAIEKKAYTAACVAARTTTGDRPAAEITSGYIRWAAWEELGQMGAAVMRGCRAHAHLQL